MVRSFTEMVKKWVRHEDSACATNADPNNVSWVRTMVIFWVCHRWWHKQVFADLTFLHGNGPRTVRDSVTAVTEFAYGRKQIGSRR